MYLFSIASMRRKKPSRCLVPPSPASLPKTHLLVTMLLFTICVAEATLAVLQRRGDSGWSSGEHRHQKMSKSNGDSHYEVVAQHGSESPPLQPPFLSSRASGPEHEQHLQQEGESGSARPSFFAVDWSETNADAIFPTAVMDERNTSVSTHRRRQSRARRMGGGRISARRKKKGRSGSDRRARHRTRLHKRSRGSRRPHPGNTRRRQRRAMRSRRRQQPFTRRRHSLESQSGAKPYQQFLPSETASAEMPSKLGTSSFRGEEEQASAAGRLSTANEGDTGAERTTAHWDANIAAAPHELPARSGGLDDVPHCVLEKFSELFRQKSIRQPPPQDIPDASKTSWFTQATCFVGGKPRDVAMSNSVDRLSTKCWKDQCPYSYLLRLPTDEKDDSTSRLQPSGRRFELLGEAPKVAAKTSQMIWIHDGQKSFVLCQAPELLRISTPRLVGATEAPTSVSFKTPGKVEVEDGLRRNSIDFGLSIHFKRFIGNGPNEFLTITADIVCDGEVFATHLEIPSTAIAEKVLMSYSEVFLPAGEAGPMLTSPQPLAAAAA